MLISNLWWSSSFNHQCWDYRCVPSSLVMQRNENVGFVLECRENLTPLSVSVNFAFVLARGSFELFALDHFDDYHLVIWSFGLFWTTGVPLNHLGFTLFIWWAWSIWKIFLSKFGVMCWIIWLSAMIGKVKLCWVLSILLTHRDSVKPLRLENKGFEGLSVDLCDHGKHEACIA